MKTTIQISDALLNRAREVAAKEDTTLKDLVEEALHRLLDERDRRKPFKLRDGSVGGGWLRPEVAELGMDKIIELSYGDRGG